MRVGQYLLRLLRDPVWQGIGAVVAIIGLLLGVVVAPALSGPRIIDGPTPAKRVLRPNEQTSVVILARGEGLIFVWTADYGAVEPTGPVANSTITYTAPGFTATDLIKVEIKDRRGRVISGETTVEVTDAATIP